MASKVYVVRYTNNADLPKARPAITVAAAKMMSIKVPFFREGYVNRLVVKQTSGDPVVCLVDLLDSSIPYPPGEQDAETAPLDDLELYRIIEPQTVSAGTALIIVSNHSGWVFHNPANSFTDGERAVYLVLQPVDSSGDTEWDVVIAGHCDIG